MRDSLRDEGISSVNTERRIRNNYVISKEHQTGMKKHTMMGTHMKEEQISKADFEVVLAVGKGGYGKVWKVIERRGGRAFAMKQMSKAKVISKKSVASVMNERNYLARLSNPFLANMFCAFQDRENLYLVLDYLDGGDLRYHLGNRQYFS